MSRAAFAWSWETVLPLPKAISVFSVPIAAAPASAPGAVARIVGLALVCLLCAGCERATETGRDHVISGLERALPDDKLGPGAGELAEVEPADPLVRSPLLAARRASRGAVRYESGTRYSLELQDGRRISIDENVTITMDGNGEYTGLRRRESTHPPGGSADLPPLRTTSTRAARWVDGRFFLQSDGGDHFEDNPMREGQLRWLREATDATAVLAELLMPICVRVAQDSATAVELQLRPNAARLESELPSDARDLHERWPDWWRSVHTVTSAEAQFELGADGSGSRGADWTSARIALTAQVERDGVRGTLTIRHNAAIRPASREQLTEVRVPENPREARRRRVQSMVDRVVGPLAADAP